MLLISFTDNNQYTLEHIYILTFTEKKLKSKIYYYYYYSFGRYFYSSNHDDNDGSFHVKIFNLINLHVTCICNKMCYVTICSSVSNFDSRQHLLRTLK